MRIEQPNDNPPRVVLRFDSNEQRDAWLNAHAPERRATNLPGLYTLGGNDNRIGVFMERVTLYGRAMRLAGERERA